MKKYMDLLRRAKIFRGVEEKDILSMLDCLTAVKKHFARGEFLYHAGESAGMAALVLDELCIRDRMRSCLSISADRKWSSRIWTTVSGSWTPWIIRADTWARTSPSWPNTVQVRTSPISISCRDATS